MKPIFAALLFFVLGSAALPANENIANAMKNFFKGDTSTFKTVAKGQGSDADIKKLYDVVTALQKEEPPLGTKESWEKRTGELARSIQLLSRGNKQAMIMVQKAGNCDSCHSAHRPKE
jgi:cytochrome c556